MIGATPVVVVGLVAMGFVGSVATLAVAALVFFTGYFVAYEPYRALYPDTVGSAPSSDAVPADRSASRG